MLYFPMQSAQGIFGHGRPISRCPGLHTDLQDNKITAQYNLSENKITAQYILQENKITAQYIHSPR